MNKTNSSTMNSAPIEVLLYDGYFQPILMGEKSVDARINKAPYDIIRIGSIIKFVGTQTKSLEAYCRVEDRREYKTFEAMLNAEGLSKCLPGVATVQEGVKTYFGFPNYETNEKTFGVVAFQIVPLPDYEPK